MYATFYTCRNSFSILLCMHYMQLKQLLTFNYLLDPSI